MLSGALPYSWLMTIKSTDIGITTHKLAESRDFYKKYLGFDVVFECDWYIHLKNGESEIGLLQPNHSSQPKLFDAPFRGDGIWLSFEVNDVDAEYQRLQAEGIRMDLELRNEPWGQRHFIFQDPNGVGIDILSKIEVSPEFAASYAEVAVS